MMLGEDPLSKGTTASAFLTKDGIIVAVDSRMSQEWMHERDAKWEPKIIDKAYKFNVITNNIINILVGTSKNCSQMIVDVRAKVNSILLNGNEVTVSSVADSIEEFLKRCRNQNRAFGTLLVGYDSIQGFQIYRLLLSDKIVMKEQAKEIASMGSGCGFANDILVHGYDYKLSKDVAKQLVIKAIVNGSVYDKNSGGTIHAYHLTNNGYEEMKPVKALNAYYNNIDHYQSRRMLFMILEVDNDTKRFSTDHFVEFFRSEADILVAHRVDERKSKDFVFYLHRLIFTNQKEAKKVLNCPKVKTYQFDSSHPPIFHHFPYTALINGVAGTKNVSLRIAEASKELVAYMVNHCPVKNSWTPSKVP